MEQARKIARDLVEPEAAGGRSRPEAQATLAADLDKVLRLATPSRDGRPDARRDAAPPQRDWSSAIDLVRRAAAMVRESQAQIVRMDAQVRDLTQRAREEVKAAEMRAQAAEARAKEAEDWLHRLTGALQEEFGSGRGAAGDAV